MQLQISQILKGRRLLITPRYIWTLLCADQTTSMLIMQWEQTPVSLWLPKTVLANGCKVC